MATGGTAQEQKAELGQSRPQGRSGDAARGGSVLGLSDGKQLEGQPSLVRSVKGKETDLWNTVLNGSGAKEIERIFQIAKLDTAYDMTDFIRKIEYQGFDRLFYIKHALTKMTVSVFARFAIVGGIRGSNFTKISETCDEMPTDLTTAFSTCGFVKTPKKRHDFTILRNTASIPHWVAYWCQKAEIVKKIPSSDCPAELQFPGAASLPMSRDVRMKHLKFCSDFSMLLPGGKFNLNIYMTAMRNEIQVQDIPNEILSVLGVNSQSESHKLTDDEVAPYSQALVRVR